VLEGSVRREAGRVRITAQLIRVRDQVHRWADNYDRQLPGILDIQQAIVGGLPAKPRSASRTARRYVLDAFLVENGEIIAQQNHYHPGPTG